MSKAAIKRRVQKRKKERKKAEREHVRKHGNVPMFPKIKPMWAPRQEQKPAPTYEATSSQYTDLFRW